MAEGLQQVGMLRPKILEAYNVEKTTRATLAAGGTGQGTRIGNLLEDTVRALGGAIVHWEPFKAGSRYDLRVHVSYP